MNARNRKYLIKLLGYEDRQAELQFLKECEHPNELLDNIHISKNYPERTCGKCLKEPDIGETLGFIIPRTTQHRKDTRHGNGIYAIAEILEHHVPLVRSTIGTPFGIDITMDEAEPLHQTVDSVNLVVKPRGNGKVISEVIRYRRT